MIYSAPWCSVCKRAKRFFQAKGIPFRELDVEKSRLNAACTAWNIANLPKHQRRRAQQRYLQRYREENQGVEDVVILRKDMEQLIKQKIKKFGKVKKPIVHAEIREDGERYSIFAASLRTGE